MHFTDLEPCFYAPGPLDADAWSVPLRAVGWLEDPHPFSVGVAPDGLLPKLKTLVDQTRRELSHHMFRGFEVCSICEAQGHVPLIVDVSEPGRRNRADASQENLFMTGDPNVYWSQENLIIPGDGEVFAAPGGIVHYIEKHGYLPPSTFITAVFKCPDVGSPEYFQALRAANGDKLPPLESYEDFLREADEWGRTFSSL